MRLRFFACLVFLWRQSDRWVWRAVPSTSHCSARRDFASEWEFFDAVSLYILGHVRRRYA